MSQQQTEVLTLSSNIHVRTKPSKTGFANVYLGANGRYYAQVRLADGRRKNVPGMHDTAAEAAAGRAAFIAKHGEADSKSATVTAA